MSRNIAVRFGLLAATLALITVTLWQPRPAAAATQGTLFGLNYNAGEVAKLDPSTGQYTTFAKLPVDPSGLSAPSFFGLASDAAGHRLFTIRATYNDPTYQSQLWQVVVIDTTSGSTTVGPALSQSFTSGLLADWVFDPSTGDLFGVTSPMVGPQVVKVDPVTGAVTHVADLPGTFVNGVTFAPGSHKLFVVGEDQSNPYQVVWSILSVDMTTGQVSPGGPLTNALSTLVYDTSSGTLFGIGGYPAPTNSVFRVDPVSGSETSLAPALGCCTSGITVDSASHTILLVETEFSGFGVDEIIESVNDQTGAYTVSTSPIGQGQPVFNIAFEGVAITPASVRAEVQQAFASGAITSQGVEIALLHKLDAASAARARGQCGVAANIYGAVVDMVRALSSGTETASGARTSSQARVSQKIDPTFAARLISDVQYLSNHCP